MQAFWRGVDRAWDGMASVKLTIVILAGLALLSVPGMLILQYNISSVDPGLEYSYDFWKWGQRLQLFTSYHSFWYVGLMVILGLNLIACSVNRWPQMLKLALAKPVKWSAETFRQHTPNLRYEWKVTGHKKEALLARLQDEIYRPWVQMQVLEDGPEKFQLFWQSGRWTRISNYLVHTSLLVVFAGAILSSLYGFEGAANIPSGSAVDTFIVFKEGKLSGLHAAPGGLINEKLLGFRLSARDFKVNFYPDFPGRPKDFISDLEVLVNGIPRKRQTIVVNDPMEFNGLSIYQASYGRLNDFKIQMRIVDKKNPIDHQIFLQSRIGEPQEVKPYQVTLVPVRALMNLQSLGPAVQFQPLVGAKPSGPPFWVLKDRPDFDFVDRPAPYAVVLDSVDEQFFTGLQVAYDPGAPIYWLGCLGMLIGTFYALFFQHRKYYLHYENGKMLFAGTIHRLPLGFEQSLQKKAKKIEAVTKGEA